MDRSSAAVVLGVAPDAGARAVERAFRRRVKVAHPDRFPPGSEAYEEATLRVQSLLEARRTLLTAPGSGSAPPATSGRRAAAAVLRPRPPDRPLYPRPVADRRARTRAVVWGVFLLSAAVVSFVIGSGSSPNPALPLWSPTLAALGLVSFLVAWRAR